ncbi:phosphatase PAP2 family protein [Marivibrio halodurans]|uniref:Phosphatase PAP2 family protein n=1 Tax=Marivibrio halodurans TaxID=2039722 RepID=A0A8J7S3C8_9PROT|nr:phosphatase PAP2 family protein [Marivibrio halodurans]
MFVRLVMGGRRALAMRVTVAIAGAVLGTSVVPTIKGQNAVAQTVVVDSNGWRQEGPGTADRPALEPMAPTDVDPSTLSPPADRADGGASEWTTTVIGGADDNAGEALPTGMDSAGRERVQQLASNSPTSGGVDNEMSGAGATPPHIGAVALRAGAEGPALTIDLSRAADFVFWESPNGRRVVVFVPGAPSDVSGLGEGGLIRQWACIEGPAPGCALAIDLTQAVTVSAMRLQRPEETGGVYRIRLALDALDMAPFARERTGIAWEGGRDLPPMWDGGGAQPLQKVSAAPRSALASGFDQDGTAGQGPASVDPSPSRPSASRSSAASGVTIPETRIDIGQEATTAVAAARVDCAVEPGDCQDPAPWDADYLSGFYEVPWEMAKRPFDFSTRSLIIDAIALGGFGALYLADEDIRDTAQDSQSGGADDFFDAVEVGGRFYGLLAVGAGAWAAGEVAGDRSLQRVGLNGFQSVLLAAIPVEATKALFGRSRPLKDQGNDDWFDEGNSFLSGHTTYAFAAASSVAHEYGHIGWVPWVAYGAAGLVGAQRIYDDKHWSSDVFLSALVGWGIGQAVADLDAFAEDSPMEMGALRTEGAQGFSLSMDF